MALELRDYLRLLRRGWLVILICLILGGGAGTARNLLSKELYKANAQVFVATSQPSDSSVSLVQGNNFAQDRVQTYVSLADSPGVTDPVIKSLGLDLTDQQLAGKITASAPSDQVLIDIAVTDQSPTKAAQIANAVATQFTSVIQTIEKVNVAGANTSPVKLTVVRPAQVPTHSASPDKTLNLGLGLAIGLVLGLVIVALRAALDNTMKRPEDFEALGLPVLGAVPFDKRTAKTPVAFRGDPHSSRSEAYRALRTNLQFVDVDNPPHLIAVTSAMPGAGKTTTSINLASALAEAGYRVCLIDADLRRPSVAETLGLVGEVGFTTTLISDTPVEDVLQNAGRNLAVLTSGPVPPNPSELLISDQARTVIADIASRVDYTIIDTPPVLAVTDGAALASIADATVIVARAGKTTIDQTERSIDALDKVGEKPVGVIINMITRTRGVSDYEYGYYYAPYRPEKNRRSDRNGSDAAETAEPTESAETTDAGEVPAEGEELVVDGAELSAAERARVDSTAD